MDNKGKGKKGQEAADVPKKAGEVGAKQAGNAQNDKGGKQDNDKKKGKNK